jgi:hypothetical protein
VVVDDDDDDDDDGSLDINGLYAFIPSKHCNAYFIKCGNESITKDTCHRETKVTEKRMNHYYVSHFP